MIGQVFGQYRIVAHLGAGGMGVVFRARDERLKRDVALKVLLEGLLADDAMRARFRREALAVAGLNHPNIGTVYNIETHGDLDFLVMEYIPGMTLHHRLAGGPLPEAQVRAFGAQIASALEESHAQGVIHRDLKPGNILVTPKDQIKVVDFGLAEVVRPQELDVTAPLTSLPEMRGTLPYMAPEQLRGHKLSAAIDIYGLGAILYEMATGQRPFPQSSAPLLAEAILRDPPVPPRTLNPLISGSLEHTIMHALEKDPAARIASASEIGAQLRSAPTEVGAAAAAGPRSLRNALWPAVIVTLVMAIAAGVYFSRGGARVGGAADVTSVVALPAQVFAEAADQFLTDAIPSALSTSLNEVSSLETKLPPSSLDFENSGRNIDKVVQAYGVNGLILSSVTVTGDRLALDLKLVDAETRRLLWSRVYEGARIEYISLIRESGSGLRAAMRPGAAHAGGQIAADSVGINSEAELLMRAGAYHASLFTNRGLAAEYEQARSALERSLVLAPTRSEAAWRLARLHATRVVIGVAPSEVVHGVRLWARRALEIDPKASSAWAALSEAEQIDPLGDRRLMLEFALRATALGPNDAYAHTRLATALLRMSVALGLEAQRRATALEPLSLSSPISEGINLAALGHYPEALGRIDYALAIEPDMPFGLLMKTLTLVVADRTPDAITLLPQLDRMVAEKRLRPEWLLLVRDYVAYGKKDRISEWEQARGRLNRLARGEIPFPRWDTATAEVASLFARQGDITGALDLLEERNRKRVLGTLDFLLEDPGHAKLRGQPRFDALVAEVRAEFRTWTELCDLARARGEFPQYLEVPYTALLARTKS